jgi:hypothetical protein
MQRSQILWDPNDYLVELLFSLSTTVIYRRSKKFLAESINFHRITHGMRLSMIDLSESCSISAGFIFHSTIRTEPTISTTICQKEVEIMIEVQTDCNIPAEPPPISSSEPTRSAQISFDRFYKHWGCTESSYL